MLTSILNNISRYKISWTLLIISFLVSFFLSYTWVPDTLADTKASHLTKFEVIHKGLVIENGPLGLLEFYSDPAKFDTLWWPYFYLALVLKQLTDSYLALKIVHSLFTSLIVVFVYYVVGKLKPHVTLKDRLLLPALLITCFGFMSYGGLVSVQDPPGVFFALISLWFLFTRKHGLFIILFIFAIRNRIAISAMVPGILIYLLIFDRTIFRKFHLYLVAVVCLFCYTLTVPWIKELLTTLFFDVEHFSSYHQTQITNNNNHSLGSITSLSFIYNFNPEYLYRIFLLSPLLTLWAIISVIYTAVNRHQQPDLFRFSMMILLSGISLGWLFFSAITQGDHYLYFAFPLTAMLCIPLLPRITQYARIIILTSLLVFLYHFQNPEQKPLYYHEINQIKQIIDPYRQQGLILQHGRDYANLIYGGGAWPQAYDYQWFGGIPPAGVTAIPHDRLANTSIIIALPDELSHYQQLPSINQFTLQPLKLKYSQLYIFTRHTPAPELPTDTT